MNDSPTQDKQATGRLLVPPVELAPADYRDPVIEFYKKDVDRTLLRENLKLTVDERFRKFEAFMRYVHELRASKPVAGRRGDACNPTSGSSSRS